MAIGKPSRQTEPASRSATITRAPATVRLRMQRRPLGTVGTEPATELGRIHLEPALLDLQRAHLVASDPLTKQFFLVRQDLSTRRPWRTGSRPARQRSGRRLAGRAEPPAAAPRLHPAGPDDRAVRLVEVAHRRATAAVPAAGRGTSSAAVRPDERRPPAGGCQRGDSETSTIPAVADPFGLHAGGIRRAAAPGRASPPRSGSRPAATGDERPGRREILDPPDPPAAVRRAGIGEHRVARPEQPRADLLGITENHLHPSRHGTGADLPGDQDAQVGASHRGGDRVDLDRHHVQPGRSERQGVGSRSRSRGRRPGRAPAATKAARGERRPPAGWPAPARPG